MDDCETSRDIGGNTGYLSHHDQDCTYDLDLLQELDCTKPAHVLVSEREPHCPELVLGYGSGTSIGKYCAGTVFAATKRCTVAMEFLDLSGFSSCA